MLWRSLWESVVPLHDASLVTQLEIHDDVPADAVQLHHAVNKALACGAETIIVTVSDSCNDISSATIADLCRHARRTGARLEIDISS